MDLVRYAWPGTAEMFKGTSSVRGGFILKDIHEWRDRNGTTFKDSGSDPKVGPLARLLI